MSSICACCKSSYAPASCRQCGVAHYCSRECQVLHWKHHKAECAALAAEPRPPSRASSLPQLQLAPPPPLPAAPKDLLKRLAKLPLAKGRTVTLHFHFSKCLAGPGFRPGTLALLEERPGGGTMMTVGLFADPWPGGGRYEAYEPAWAVKGLLKVCKGLGAVPGRLECTSGRLARALAPAAIALGVGLTHRCTPAVLKWSDVASTGTDDPFDDRPGLLDVPGIDVGLLALFLGASARMWEVRLWNTLHTGNIFELELPLWLARAFPRRRDDCSTARDGASHVYVQVLGKGGCCRPMFNVFFTPTEFHPSHNTSHLKVSFETDIQEFVDHDHMVHSIQDKQFPLGVLGTVSRV